MACQYNQLCDGLKAQIDGAIHEVQALWDENLTTEERGFFSWAQITCSTGLIESECFGRSETYGRPDIFLSSTSIFTGHRLSY